ncbi:hypothetical protein [Clostridium sp. ZS2-4]|uniref:hypothetical protein n=1 Tax=Clostridium sp. ZS2-4 TaxID=2987703 RepID=UPI00227C2A1C|nr:hypothetical protein [Clostridium sp. ZS2-4]MCY6354331.1 hypothetical protein [Clostridium sp. ZS2-4]
MNHILKKRVNKNSVYIVLINIIIIISYKIGNTIVAKLDLLFRGWIDILYMINVLSFIITIIVSINIFLCSKEYSKIKDSIIKNALKIISSIVTAIIVTICCVEGLFILAFFYEPEHIIYEQNQKVIAKVVPHGFHHTQIDFYEPVNIFLMRKSNIPSKIYDGSYDIYEER